MRTFWTVMKLELFLIWCNWAIWLIALVMLCIGAVIADNDLNQPWQILGQLTFFGLLLPLILAFSTGNQINRDRERRLDNVIFSTPVTTPIYVLAKYSAALLSLLGLAGLSLLAAILTDQVFRVPLPFLSPVVYPSLGPQVYLLGWTWFFLVPVIFGSAFMLSCTTLARGRHVVAYTAALLIWLIPIFTRYWLRDLFFDVTALSIGPQPDPALAYFYQNLMGTPSTVPSAHVIQQIMSLVRADVPLASSLNTLLLNRLFFLVVALVLLCLTIYGVQRMRQNA